MLTDATGEDQPVEARKRGGHGRDSGGGSADEHVDGDPCPRVPLTGRFLDLPHAGGPAKYADQPGLVIDVIDRVPGLGASAGHVRQHMVDERLRHRQYTRDHGEDMPDVRDWTWPY